MSRPSLMVNLIDDDSVATPSPGRFGGKGIGLFASIALTVNNISGPGMLEFPQMFQRAGYLPTLTALAVVCIVSTLFATTLADTIARIPYNKSFRLRIEFSDVFERYIGRSTAMFTQAVFYLTLLSQNVAAIVACAQMFDSFAGSFYPGSTYAVRISPLPVMVIKWEPSKCLSAKKHAEVEQCVPFASEGDDALFITAGYVSALLVLAPLGLLTLEENMAQQKLSFFALLLLTSQFLYTFCSSGLSAGHVPYIGEHWMDAIGVVIFNFAFCVTIPSWLNEKARGVSINRVCWTSTIASTVLYACVGFFGACAFTEAPENMLSLMLSPRVSVTTRLCGILFGILIIGLGVPIFTVLMRYNLVNGGLCSEGWAHVWSSVLPWMTAWMLYQGSVTLKLLSYSGLILNGLMDFIMPGVVTLISLDVTRRLTRRCQMFRTCMCSAPAVAPSRDPEGSEAANPPSPAAVSAVQPFPSWLHPFYVPIIAALVALVGVLLPVAAWLQISQDFQ